MMPQIILFWHYIYNIHAQCNGCKHSDSVQSFTVDGAQTCPVKLWSHNTADCSIHSLFTCLQIFWLVIPGNVSREGRKPRMICNNTFDDIPSMHTGDKCSRNNLRIESVGLFPIKLYVNLVVRKLNSNINNVVLLLYMKIRFHVKVLPKHIIF